ncbi:MULTISPECIES: hypothetical protein [unclassified Nocardia]|uniref:hypothetical protein n=1 Tax=unclassified Nocardia TaxID=2637762 RepID=UPI0024A8383D|nr:MULTISPECIES: hypothetical protein [unclassified Nocardia]
MSAPCHNRTAAHGPDLLDRATHRLVWLLVDIRRALLAAPTRQPPVPARRKWQAEPGTSGEGARHRR